MQEVAYARTGKVLQDDKRQQTEVARGIYE